MTPKQTVFCWFYVTFIYVRVTLNCYFNYLYTFIPNTTKIRILSSTKQSSMSMKVFFFLLSKNIPILII